MDQQLEKPRRGRPPRQEEEKAQRRRRNTDTLGGKRKRLAVSEDDLDRNAYAYRWANDEDNRIHSLTVEDDWEVVDTGAESDGLGTGTQKRAGSTNDGKALNAVLLRKPRALFDEDYAASQRRIDEQEAALTQPQKDGQYVTDAMRVERGR